MLFLCIWCFITLFEINNAFQCPTNLDTDVLILGAGIAGISAAQTLHENGIDNFVIIEGKDRIGGRMKHESFGGTTINIGANWISGVSESGESAQVNPVWKLKQKCGLNVSITDYDDGITYNKQGDIIDFDDFRWDDYYYAYFQVYNMSINMPTLPEGVLQQGINVTDGDINVQDALALAGWIPKTEGDAMVQFSEYDWDEGNPPNQSGVKLFKVESNTLAGDFGEDEFYVTDERGYDFIVQCIADEFLEETDPRLLLNSAVKKINWKDECVCVDIEQADGVKSLCGLNSIVTFSQGVLEDAAFSDDPFVDIQPPFPQWKLNAFQQIYMAYYFMLWAEFEYKFWDDSEYIYRASYKPGEPQPWPVFQSLGLSNGKFSSNFPPDTPILVATVVGTEALRLNTLTKQEITDEMMVVLKSMYGQDIPNPKNVTTTDWLNDPFFRGTWVNTRVGADTSTIEIIAAPLGAMHFCGEHTSSRFPGYTHGAYLEGQRVGQNVAWFIKN